jgi:small subunit ribosomal protein S1
MAEDPKESFAALFEVEGGKSRRGERLRPGERLDVKVVAVGQSAVFADLGARGGKLEGFFEKSDLSDKSGKVMVEIGSSIAAVVAHVDDVAGQVRLTPVFVRRSNDAVDEGAGGEVRIPVSRSGPLLVEGAHVRGTVTGVERYGVFVQIEGTQGRSGRGLVPAAETGAPRGADLRKHFPPGAVLEAKIVAIADDGKIRLSVKALVEDAERANFEAYAGGDAAEAQAAPSESGGAGAAARSAGKKPAPKAPAVRGFGTLGDLLGGAGAPKAAPAKAPSRKR